MARALECPACGARHRLDNLPESATFTCDRCGQVLKVPASISSDPSAPPPPARTGAPGPAAPPPRRAAPAPVPARAPADVEPATRTAPARNVAAVSATVAASEQADNGAASRRDRRGAAPAPTPAAAPAKRSRVHWYWRTLAWIVAVPLGFVLTAWPAYEFGFIKKDDLLDIFVGTGVGRYVRLAIVTLVWALVTALLVQLFVEGGRARAARRRRSRAVTA